jgi:hypothetical protein
MTQYSMVFFEDILGFLRDLFDVHQCRIRIFAFFAMLLVGTACVETKVEITVRKDGSGTAVIQQVIPGVLLPDHPRKFVEIKQNRLLFYDEAEIRQHWDKPGTKVLSFESRRDKHDDVRRETKLFLDYLYTRTELEFAALSDLSTSHLEFADFSEDGKRYLAMHLVKVLDSKQLDQEYGGMGPLVAAAVQDRHLTLEFNAPLRVEDGNQSKTDWNRAQWIMPLSALFDKIQDEVTAWIQIKGENQGPVQKVQSWINSTVREKDWKTPGRLPKYFALPVPGMAQEKR